MHHLVRDLANGSWHGLEVVDPIDFDLSTVWQ